MHFAFARAGGKRDARFPALSWHKAFSLMPFAGYSHRPGAVLPAVPHLVLHSRGYRGAEKPQMGGEDVLLGQAEGGICPGSLWVERKD